jgi:hypothetical protein
MASIISSDSGLVSGVPGLKTSADATGALQIQTGNNVTAITVDASQNVGIGTASPTQKLDVVGSIKSSALTSGRVPYASTGGLLVDSANMTFNGTSLTLASDTTLPTLSVLSNSATPSLRIGAQGNLSVYWQIGRDNVTTGDFIFSTEASEKVRFTNGGNVGIGITSPQYKLVVAASGGNSFEFGPENTTSTNILQCYNRTTSAYTNLAYNALSHQFSVSGVLAVTVDSSGKVGIGTSSPSSYGLFTVLSSTAGSAKISIQDTSGGASPAPLLQFGINSSNGFNTSDAARVWTTSPSSSTAALNFAAYNGGAPSTAQMTLTGGRVGIGTTTPAAPLQVGPTSAGSINGYTKFIVDSSDYAVITLKSPAANFNQIIFTDTTSTGLGGINYFNSTNATPNAMAFLTAATERMRIDSSGNVGIGTSSPAYKLDVAGSVNVSSDSSYTLGAGADRYIKYRSGNGDILYSFSAGNFYQQSITSSYHAWFTGNNERMRIDSSGNLGIGTTTPTAGYKLNVGSTSDVTTLNGAAITLFTSGSLTSNVGGVLNFRPQLGTTISDIFNLSICAYDHSGDGNADGLSINGADGVSFSTGGNTRSEKMRIDSSGNVVVMNALTGGTGAIFVGRQTTIANAKIEATGNDNILVTNQTDTGTSGKNILYILRNTNYVGGITCTNTTTSFPTSSDYRLKQDIAPMTGALDKVAALKPVTYKWKLDGSDGEGFIAHELAEVCPRAVTGEKDAVDENGNPKYQGIDVSFLVATLTAAIQEQQALITSLTARIVALELT